MHPLEEILTLARLGTLTPRSIAGWRYAQFGCDTKEPCLSIVPPDDTVPTHIFAVNEIESPTHLRILIQRLEKEYND